MSEPLRLNLGAGDDPACQIHGFITVDRKSGGEIYPLKLPDGTTPAPGSVSEIYASHCLEHLGAKGSRLALCEWASLLKPGGRLRVAVPDLYIVCKNYVDGVAQPTHGYLYGGQTDENDFHRCGFDEEELRDVMEKLGLVNVKRFDSCVSDCSSLPISLNMEGYKPAHSIPPATLKIPKTYIVMSMPRLAFSDNLFSMVQVATARNLGFEKVTGAFWGQCLERVMESRLDDGTEWILLVDYDTVANTQQFDELCRLMLEHPEADAIAPVQIKRDDKNLLMGVLQEDGTPYPPGTKITVGHFNPELVRVAWSHCGFTLLRVASLRKLKKPWFHSIPDANGGWNEGRIDDDIFWWRRWAEAGNTLYLATKVPIAHAQLVLTWPDVNLEPLHQYTTDFYKRGLPEDVRK